LVIDCMGAGETEPGRLVTRSGASPGDLVAVTGKFGSSAAGLKMLISKRKLNSQERATLERAVFLPKARLLEGIALARTGALTSSIDSSDGLAWSLHEIARNSQVAFHIDRVPIAREAAYFGSLVNISPVRLALYGGEEYELVFTFKKRDLVKVKKAVPSILVIGRADRGPAKVTAVAGGGRIEVEPRGYEHFRD
jgi:thiamine-monophosphate kinase